MTIIDSPDTAAAVQRLRPPPPMAMLAELTHRCPLACPYCSNPLELTRVSQELSTEEWIEVFRQAECEVSYERRSCSAAQSSSFLGRDTAISIHCAGGEKIPFYDTDIPDRPGPETYGDGARRVLSCHYTLTLQATIPLATQTVPGGGQVFAPGAGRRW